MQMGFEQNWSEEKSEDCKTEDLCTEVAKPWLDSQGNIQSDSALKEISKSWSADTWEKFLSQTVDVEQSETILSPLAFENLTAIDPSTVWSSDSTSNFPQPFHQAVQKSLRLLTSQQLRVIKLVYWKDQSIRDCAKIMGVGRSLVSRQKWNSIRKLKRLSEIHVDTFTIGKREAKFKERNFRSRTREGRTSEN